MPILPTESMALSRSFAALFTPRTWVYVPVLVVGGILTPGRRMVRTVLRTMGPRYIPRFQNFHCVLNRALWSALVVSRVLLELLHAVVAHLAELLCYAGPPGENRA